MVGEKQCRWPPKDNDVQSMAKDRVEYKDDWAISNCEILCQASKLIKIIES